MSFELQDRIGDYLKKFSTPMTTRVIHFNEFPKEATYQRGHWAIFLEEEADAFELEPSSKLRSDCVQVIDYFEAGTIGQNILSKFHLENLSPLAAQRDLLRRVTSDVRRQLPDRLTEPHVVVISRYSNPFLIAESALLNPADLPVIDRDNPEYQHYLKLTMSQPPSDKYKPPYSVSLEAVVATLTTLTRLRVSHESLESALAANRISRSNTHVVQDS
jgi:hypothetical protein